MLISAYFLLYRLSVVTFRRLLISVRSTSCSTASSPPLRRGALRFLPVIRDANPDDAESALGAAAEPVIPRDEDPDDAEAASGAGSEPDDEDDDEDERMCSSES